MTTCLALNGIFSGKRGDSVIQYLGVQYATLRDQLSVPEMITHYGIEIVDAANIGPRAPAIDGCAMEQDALIQCNIGVPPSPPMSGTECLNLNITVPDIKFDELLPVMVFIHGGGFIMGANYWPQYDPARLVKLSAELDSPVIVVNINYRLGVLDGLTSEELRVAGYPGNNSLRDQRCALQWLKEHIEGFGGDAENVTAFGESAGAMAVLAQLSSPKPLFKRAVSMSGTPLMLKPLSRAVTETSYATITKELGIDDLSSEERIQRLLAITPDDIVAKTPMSVPLTPYFDDDIITTLPTFAGLAIDPQFPSWCEELLLGSCQHDGNVFYFMGLAARRANIASAVHASFHAHMSATAVEAVLNAYDITLSTPDTEAMEKIIQLGTDIAYVLPAIAYAKAFPGKTWRYSFDEGNPWDGMFQGKATHMLDAAFLFQNFNDRLDGRGKQVARSLARDFIGFANGEGAPWGQYEQKQVRVYGSCARDGEEQASIADKSEGQSTLMKLSSEGRVDLDELSRAWDLFVAGK